MYYGYGMDWTYVLVLIGMVISMAASAKVKGTFAKYSRVRCQRGYTGLQTAAQILQKNRINDVQIMHVRGELTDHYNPGKKVVNLSDSVYDSDSVAAVGVAAHECGHVIQHATGYAPLNFRTALVPAANFGSMIGIPICVLGLILGGMGSTMVTIGIWLFSLSVLFQIVTLPVEFNASSRALRQIEEQGILSMDELRMAREVLSAAALTYVAAAAASVLQLLRLILIFGGRRRD